MRANLFLTICSLNIKVDYSAVVGNQTFEVRKTMELTAGSATRILSIEIYLKPGIDQGRNLCYDNYVAIYSNGRYLLKGICSKGLLYKQLYTCDSEARIFLDENSRTNPFLVNAISVEDSGSLAKPAVCNPTPLIPSSVRCRNESDNARIIGGRPAKNKDHPWHVKVSGNSCGGTIIGEYYVITAGHCCAGKSSIKITVTHDSYRRTYSSSKIILNPYYNDNTLVNDICILRFSESLLLHYSSSPACLPHPNDRPTMGTECYIAGYGYQEYDNPDSVPPTIMEITMPIIDYDTCGEWFHMDLIYGTSKPTALEYIKGTVTAQDNPINYQIDTFDEDGIICAGSAYGKTDACQGDSGGPFICLDDNKPVLQGVVSWGVRCGERLLPGVFTRVAKHADWIYEVTAINYKTTISASPLIYGGHSDDVTLSSLLYVHLLYLLF